MFQLNEFEILSRIDSRGGGTLNYVHTVKVKGAELKGKG